MAKLKLQGHASGTGIFTLSPPNSSTDRTITLPDSSGALLTDGSTIDTAQIADDAVTADKLANSINTEIAANTAKTGITTSQANAITANTAKVTNATHTGDVTGATALTIAADAVTVDKLNLISTGSVPSLEAKGTSGVTDGYIQLNCAENSHGIKLKSPPHSATASYTLTFPNDDGNANQKLTTNGSGVLTWTDDNATDPTKLPLSGGTMTGTIGVTTVDFGDWTITENSNVLYFATGGTNKMKLDASGNLTCVGDVTANGSI